MKTRILSISTFPLVEQHLFAQKNSNGRWAAMYPTKNIVECSELRPYNFSCCFSATGLVLHYKVKVHSPFCYAAFGKFPEGTVATLLKPENKNVTNDSYLPCVAGR
jgi:uncharacterized surface protein with fasciclin (FAS1) repeats